jgi:hypothetical protein
MAQMALRRGFSAITDSAGEAAEEIIKANPNGILKEKVSKK